MWGWWFWYNLEGQMEFHLMPVQFLRQLVSTILQLTSELLNTSLEYYSSTNDDLNNNFWLGCSAGLASTVMATIQVSFSCKWCLFIRKMLLQSNISNCVCHFQLPFASLSVLLMDKAGRRPILMVSSNLIANSFWFQTWVLNIIVELKLCSLLLLDHA